MMKPVCVRVAMGAGRTARTTDAGRTVSQDRARVIASSVGLLLRLVDLMNEQEDVVDLRRHVEVRPSEVLDVGDLSWRLIWRIVVVTDEQPPANGRRLGRGRLIGLDVHEAER